MRVLLTALSMLFISTLAFAETNQTEDWQAPDTYSVDDIVEREERLSNLYEELDQKPDSQRRTELYTLIAEAYRDLLTSMQDTEAYSIDDEFTREEMLAQIYEELEQYPTPQREAELLYEEAMLMLETPEEMYSLKVATNSLLYAIELDPEYKDVLCDIYEECWKDRDFTGDDEISKSWWAIKDKVKVIVEECNRENE